jgi:hypothetical protein
MRPSSSKILSLALYASFLLMLFVSGCASSSGGSSSPGGSADTRTLKETGMDVSRSMTQFRNAVAAGTVTQARQAQINEAYSRFESAYHDALQAVNDNRNAPASDNVKALATEVIGQIQAIP